MSAAEIGGADDEMSRGPGHPAASPPGFRLFKEADELPHGVVAMLRMTERQLLVYEVAVAAPVAALRQIPGLFEVVDDLGRRSLGDPDGLCDVSEAHGRVGGKHLEHVGVVRYEPEKMILSAGS